MITPRQTRLFPVPDLPTFQRVIALAACHADLARVRASAILVPTRAAAAHVRRTLENLAFEVGARRTENGARRTENGERRTENGERSTEVLFLPDLLTRDDWYSRMHERVPQAPPRLTEFERNVMMAAAAREAVQAGASPPFRLRPGLIVDMLVFYDALRRLRRTVDTFEGSLLQDLEPGADSDRGADRLLRQTRFLSATFRAFERRVAASGSVDEHALREILLHTAILPPFEHVVVTIGDSVADEDGLWPADFDLLTRLPGLARLDVIATERALAAGFRGRLHEALPGIEEASAGDAGDGSIAWHEATDGARGTEHGARSLVLLAPSGKGDPLYFTARDREEELVEVARALKAARREGAVPDRQDGGGAAGRGDRPAAQPLDRTAVIVKRLLPYVYLAREVFGSSGIPYQTPHALPLAAEPYAAALDLMFAFVTSGFTRASTVALLRSPHLTFERDGHRIGAGAVAALDRALSDVRYLGDRGTLARLAEGWTADPHVLLAGAAARAAADAADALDVLTRVAPASEHLATLLAFLAAHDRLPPPADPLRERHVRARAAILAGLHALRQAHLVHDDPPCTIEEVAAAVRRWIEGEMFAPAPGSRGLHLVDAQAARYGDFDEGWIVGAIEREWPEAPRRNIFYPVRLIEPFGWPSESDRQDAARAAFWDLLALPRRHVAVSTFTLEDDAIVNASALLEDLADADLPVARQGPGAPARIFAHEGLSQDPVISGVATGHAAAWAILRLDRSPADAPKFHGAAGPRSPVAYAVSHVERYLECPFKYFAAHVLKLPEEPEDEEAMTPKARGRLIHDVLRAFFEEWDRTGRGAITPDNRDEALAVFRSVVERVLAGLPDAEAALERLHLVGSAAATGLAESVVRMEAERPTPVVERLLEYAVDGECTVSTGTMSRRVKLRGRVDRIDLLADGTFRLIDYKLGRAPDRKRAVQLPVYAVAARQQLEGYRGATWELAEAGYLAFREPRGFVPLSSRAKELDAMLAQGQARFINAVEGIERGEFPPSPAEPFLCRYCPYPGVCRKDYVGDD